MAKTRRCVYCDKEFEAKYPRHIFCSLLCRKRYHNQKHTDKVKALKSDDTSIEEGNLKIMRVLSFNNNIKVWIIKSRKTNTYYWKSFKNDKISIESDGMFPNLISCISDARKAFI